MLERSNVIRDFSYLIARRFFRWQGFKKEDFFSRGDCSFDPAGQHRLAPEKRADQEMGIW